MVESEFGDEFRALKGAKYIDASEALSDPRTLGYRDTYLMPLGITSLLDVGIQAGSRHYGVLCFEHIGLPRQWQADEISFAMVLADQLAITLQNALRAQAEAALRESETYNKVLFAGSRIPLVVLDPESGLFVDCNQAAVDIYCLGERDQVLGKAPQDVSTALQYDGRDLSLIHI